MRHLVFAIAVAALLSLASPAQAISSPCAQLQETLAYPTLTLTLPEADFLVELYDSCTPDSPQPLRQAYFAPKRVSYVVDVEQWRPLVAGHFESADVSRVLCLMGYESGGDPNAYNPSGASGLMQIMPFWANHFGLARSELFTPEINLWVARRVRDIQGWYAWSPYKRGHCR